MVLLILAIANSGEARHTILDLRRNGRYHRSRLWLGDIVPRENVV